MACVCNQKLQGSVEAYANMPLEDLAASVPSDVNVPGIQASLLSLMGTVGLSAGAEGGASGSGSAAASASASGGASASAVANTQALLGSYSSLGTDPVAAGASQSMSQSIQSMNTNLPWALGQLGDLFGPIAGPLGVLSASLSASSLVQGLFGFPLSHPEASSMLQASVSSSSAASAGASISSQASASAEASLPSLASSLGFDLSTQTGCDAFSATVASAASFEGSVDLPVSALGATSGTLGLLQAFGTMGLDLGSPTALKVMGSWMPALFAGLGALMSLTFPSSSTQASAGASGSASASASGSASAAATSSMSLAASTPQLSLPDVPDPSKLSLASSLSAQLGASVSGSSLSACSTCPLTAAIV